MSWAALGALILGILLLRAIFDPNTNIYKCPTCGLVIARYTRICPRCRTQIVW